MHFWSRKYKISSILVYILTQKAVKNAKVVSSENTFKDVTLWILKMVSMKKSENAFFIIQIYINLRSKKLKKNHDNYF